MTRAEKIKKLEDEIASIVKKRKELGAKLEELQKKLTAAKDATHADALRAHVGKTVRYRRDVIVLGVPAKQQRMMQSPGGVLTEVRRANCSVDFGVEGMWSVPCEYLEIVTDYDVMAMGST